MWNNLAAPGAATATLSWVDFPVLCSSGELTGLQLAPEGRDPRMTETTAPKSAKKPRWTSLEICLIAIVSLLFIIIVALIVLFATQKTGECHWWKDPVWCGVAWCGEDWRASILRVQLTFFFLLLSARASSIWQKPSEHGRKRHPVIKMLFLGATQRGRRAFFFFFSLRHNAEWTPRRAHMQSAIGPRLSVLG